MNKLNVSTSELIQMSRQELIDYRQTGETSSPASVELFRRAFDDDEEAWSSVYELFGPLMKNWVGVPNNIDIEDVLQDAFLRFLCYAPHISGLLATESLGPILAYLRRCVKTTLIDMIRASNRQPSVDPDELMPDELSDNNIIEQSDSTIALVERVDELLYDRKEKVVFHLRFSCNMPPRLIIAEHPDVFKDYQEVATIIQRLKRRLRQDPILKELRNSSIDMSRANIA